MKKFFKALALVLALALVVGVLPTAEAQAAKTHKVLKTKTLFIGGSHGVRENSTKKCGTKESVTLRYIAGYTKDDAKGHTFSADVTDGKSYVKVSGGKITALEAGVGKTATIMIKVDGKEVGTPTTIKICKNATQESLTIVTQTKNEDGKWENVADAVNGLPTEFVAGVEYLFKLPQGGKDTDQRKLLINGMEMALNEYEADGITLKKRNFRHTFKVEEAGSKAKIEIKAYQSDKFNGDSTTPKTFNIPVVVKLITDAEQKSYKTFALTFDTADHAKQARDNSKKYLSSGHDYVTDQQYVIELFSDPDNEAQRKNVYLSDFSIDEVNAPNVVICTVFGDLDQKAKYEVAYGEEKLNFNTVEWYPKYIRVGYTYIPEDPAKLDLGGTARLWKQVVNVNDDGNDVDITDKVVDYINWYYEEAPVENQANTAYYSFDTSDATVIFSAPDKRAFVDVTFKYDDGVKTPITLKERTTATSSYTVSWQLKYYWSVPYDTQKETKKCTKAEIYSNTTQQLYVTLVNASGTVVENVQNDEYVTFESSNEDSLTVSEDGVLEAGNKDYTRNTDIYVKYLGKRIGTITVKVMKTPHLASLKINAYNGKLLSQVTTASSVSVLGGYAAYVPTAETLEFDFIALDENGYLYPATKYNTYIEKINADGLTATQVNINGGAGLAAKNDSKEITPGASSDDNYTGSVTFTTNTNITPGTKYSASYKLTVLDTETANAKAISQAINFTVKNVDGEEARTYKVVDVSSDTNVANSYAVYGYDKDGFRTVGYYLSQNIGKENVALTARQDKNNRLYIKFTDPYGNFRRAVAATSAAVVKTGWAPDAASYENIPIADLQTVAIFVPIENVAKAGLPTINSQAEYITSDVDEAYATTRLAGGSSFYDYATIKTGIYGRNSSLLGTQQTFVFKEPSYITLTWKWTNKGAYSYAGSATAALDECIRFTYKYHDVVNDEDFEVKNLTFTQLNTALPGLFDVSYVKSNSDVRFMYVYVNQYAAALKAYGVANVKPYNVNVIADADAIMVARPDTEAWFINDGAINPADDVWTAIKIDRNTKLAD